MGEEKRTRRALVTGGAGFIGYHLAKRLLTDGWIVVSVDGMTPYYDLALKRCRIEMLQKSNAFTAHEVMLEDMTALTDAYVAAQPDVVVHLAAQAGVRYSLENPRAYVDANLIGSFNVLELVRNHSPAHFLLASTSSVYGANTILPFGEMDQTDHAMTLYAATKKATEVMSHSYAHLWKIPTTAFRFFTVYGPWGRPDMALFKFVKAMLADQPIDVYGQGDMQRDFTYIDDLIESIVRLIDCPPVAGAPIGSIDSLSPVAPHRVVNIGGGHPVDLLGFIKVIEQSLGRRAKLNMLPMQPGDVRATSASAELIEKLIGYKPSTSVETGVQAFVDWYRSYHTS
ncbi:SDR family NAD(P)-dependent oxidoreductase [Nitrobacter sp. JJSN]|uniref:SDR family NAD(P)-dependent oxidoreductase n=1 Tax=Nitrobacter sp. JJSN TaxID=3453033 RepID=UPI003F764AD8